MTDLPFSCRCGALKGTLHDVSPSGGNHARCFCSSCRAGLIFTGADDPGDKGVPLFQSTPDKVSFESGEEHLAVFSFGPKNVLRWQAACCGAGLFITLRNPKIAMATILTERLGDTAPLGPEKSRAFVPVAGGKTKHEGAYSLIVGAVTRALAARITGRWKDTPFFDVEKLEPVAAVKLITKAERAALLAQS